ncbi:Pectinesterase inhibitor [Melia azedarach]|uniref:Pectinesterase inhibitor n=1 Tax=Melia azedarach TaxID=155640 RepID=A0ACC1YXT8_MELAZ|nr:Pectinesterase inhibitor [Melia azedarach]
MASSYKFLVDGFAISHVAMLLLFNVNNFNIAMADTTLIDAVCKRYTDYGFCVSTFASDPRSATADLNGLGKLSTQITMNLLQQTLSDDIPKIRNNIRDPVGLQRLNVCQSDYQTALQKFAEAFKSTDNKAYPDVINWVRDGTNLVIDCQNIYRRSEPITESPTAAVNQKVINLVGVILTVNDMLMGLS